MKKFFRNPPAQLTGFFDLFHLIWDQGIGNTAQPDGQLGAKWTPDSLSAAFESAGGTVSERAIDDWHSRKRVPGAAHLRTLIQVVSNRETRPAWRDALLQTARNAREARRRETAPPQDENTPEPDGPEITFLPDSIRKPKRWRWALMAAMGTVILAASAFKVASSGSGATALATAGHRFSDPFASGKGVGPEMIVLPTGHFVKGSPESETGRRSDEGRRHSVVINYKFAVSLHEVTRDQWQACVDDGGCNGYVPDNPQPGRGSLPVVNVSYNDIFAYTHWLNKRLGIDQKSYDRYTLLSESEWEYAALSGTQGSNLFPYYTGASIAPSEANFSPASGVSQGLRTVGSYSPNRWGLYDMHGNAAERVEDCYRDFHDPSIADGSAYLDTSCSRRVVKGGSYTDGPEELRAASRRPERPEDRSADIGFRLARRLEPR